MKIRDMVKRGGSHHKWIFVANPDCCEKCKAMNGATYNGTKPKFYGHVPDRERKVQLPLPLGKTVLRPHLTHFR